MKKFLILSLLLVTQFAWSASEPQWSEYAPTPAAINITDETPKTNAALVILEAICTSQETYYFRTRKKEFDTAVSACRVIGDTKTKSKCYDDVRQAELNKNNRFYEAKQRALEYDKIQTYAQIEQKRIEVEQQRIEANQRAIKPAQQINCHTDFFGYTTCTQY